MWAGRLYLPHCDRNRATLRLASAHSPLESLAGARRKRRHNAAERARWDPKAPFEPERGRNAGNRARGNLNHNLGGRRKPEPCQGPALPRPAPGGRREREGNAQKRRGMRARKACAAPVRPSRIAGRWPRSRRRPAGASSAARSRTFRRGAGLANRTTSRRAP